MNKKLYVIGSGPGSREEMTFRAAHALEECDVIAGYKTYTDLIRADYPDKDYIVTGMTKETDRCRMALERAQDGACVALVSSGDAGVYGMAGLVYQLGTAYPDVDITVIPGITAACSGAARLGAPLMNDFCLISLSDLMTPWETIEKRLSVPQRLILSSACTIREATSGLITSEKPARLSYAIRREPFRPAWSTISAGREKK